MRFYPYRFDVGDSPRQSTTLRCQGCILGCWSREVLKLVLRVALDTVNPWLQYSHGITVSTCVGLVRETVHLVAVDTAGI